MRVVVGLGNNVDAELVWNASILERLAAAYGVRADELDSRPEVRNERDLVVSILYHIKAGIGGEQFVVDERVIDSFAAHFEKCMTLGGTGVRAAISMAAIGVPSTVHLVTTNSIIRSLLPPICDTLCSNEQDSAYPHLIIQYPRSAVVHVDGVMLTASRENRLIYNHNPDNIAMKLNPALKDKFRDANAVLLSGLNAMHNLALLDSRIDELLYMMRTLPPEATVYLEDAGYFDNRLRDRVQERLCPHVQIYGMNEDELQELSGHPLELLDAPAVLEVVRTVHARLHVPTLVVHSRYWVLAYGRVTPLIGEALYCGMRMAVTRIRCGDSLNATHCLETERLPRHEGAVLFSGELRRLASRQVICHPGFVVAGDKLTTIGLGDAFVGGFLSRYAALE